MDQLRKIRNQYQRLHDMMGVAKKVGINLPLSLVINKSRELKQEAIRLNYSPDILTLDEEVFEWALQKPDFIKNYQLCENN